MMKRLQRTNLMEGPMTATQRRTTEDQSVPQHEPRISKMLEDRIPADGEQVAHILDPHRTEETIRYPDPSTPHEANVTSAQSNAEIQMARRTDAGPSLGANRATSEGGSTMLLWFAGAAGLFLVVAILIAFL
jgi:hypothetical protein